MKRLIVNLGDCPYCCKTLGATIAPDMPRPGDTTLCLECTSVLVFDAQLQVRAPHMSELIHAMVVPGTAEILAALWGAL